MSVRVRSFGPQDVAAVLRINALGRPGVAALGCEELGALQDAGAQILVAVVAGDVAGYLIAFDDDADYDGEEFRVFQRRLARPFVYVDQVAVDAAHARAGIASALYASLATARAHAGAQRQCCEVNTEPPNPVSLAFHRQLGFRSLGSLRVTDGRTVDLLVRDTRQE